MLPLQLVVTGLVPLAPARHVRSSSIGMSISTWCHIAQKIRVFLRREIKLTHYFSTKLREEFLKAHQNRLNRGLGYLFGPEMDS